MGAQVLLGLVVLACSHDNCVFYRADHNLRINALLSAESVNCVVELACHNSVLGRSFPVLSCSSTPLGTENFFQSSGTKLAFSTLANSSSNFRGSPSAGRCFRRASDKSSVNRPDSKCSSRPSKCRLPFTGMRVVSFTRLP